MVGNRIYIKTFGCTVNHSDSEVMGGLLREAGFDVIFVYGGEDDSSASITNDFDVVIINSCTVKNLAESKFFRELKFWIDHNMKIIVAGCVPQAEKKMLYNELKDVSVIGTRQITHIVDVVKEVLHGKIVHDLSDDFNERLELPKIRKNEIIEIIPILEGCAGNCSYCKTKFARGELMSYPNEKIIAQFKNAVSDGCKEFWITSQDNGCYGFDIYHAEKYFLPQLLNELLDIDGDFRIRLGMCNPNHIDRIKDDLVSVFKHPKMFKFLHIPLQSGDNKVLRDMRRGYTIEDFRDIIRLFRKEIPDITISTDIIVGFPGESEEEFMNTLNVIREFRFDMLNLSRFWPRIGTDAVKMKQLPSTVLIERSKMTKLLFEKICADNNISFVGTNHMILVDDIENDDNIIGRTESYKFVVIKNISDIKLGMFIMVKIVDSDTYRLIGELI